MIKTKKLYEDGFYIFESRAAANSNYIENIREARKLMIYIRYYLKSYVIIHDYIITRHGWQLAVKINIKRENISGLEDLELWRIISERVRLMISTYVRCINKWRGRKGVLVQSNYARYYFETLKEAKIHLEKMRNQKLKLYQSKKKYRGIKSHYRIDKALACGSIFLCSKELRTEEENGSDFIDNQLFWTFSNLVGAKLVSLTKSNHLFRNSTKKSNNTS